MAAGATWQGVEYSHDSLERGGQKLCDDFVFGRLELDALSKPRARTAFDHRMVAQPNQAVIPTSRA